MTDIWDKLVEEYEPFIDRVVVDSNGNEYVFFGLVYGSDDLYYGLKGDSGFILSSCVGHLFDHYKLLEISDNPSQGKL